MSKVQRPGPDTPGGPRVARNCEVCHQEFWPRVVDVQQGWGKHCSNTCSGKISRDKVAYPIACKRCGLSFVARNVVKYCKPCLPLAIEERAATLRKPRISEQKRLKTAEEKHETYRFYKESHRELYRASSRKWREREKIDPAMLAKRRASDKKYKTSDKGRLICRLHRQRRRAALRTTPQRVTPLQIKIIFSAFAGFCAYCPEPATTIDHVIPLAKGGEHIASNLLPACSACNSLKGAMSLDAWAKLRGLPVVFVEALRASA
jgi:5-methylcytosine-specific restriction endonuclease McrA